MFQPIDLREIEILPEILLLLYVPPATAYDGTMTWNRALSTTRSNQWRNPRPPKCGQVCATKGMPQNTYMLKNTPGYRW